MVAFGSLFYAVQIFFKVFFVCPRRRVNTLQHFVVRIAAPVCTGNFHQLEGIADMSG